MLLFYDNQTDTILSQQTKNCDKTKSNTKNFHQEKQKKSTIIKKPSKISTTKSKNKKKSHLPHITIVYFRPHPKGRISQKNWAHILFLFHPHRPTYTSKTHLHSESRLLNVLALLQRKTMYSAVIEYSTVVDGKFTETALTSLPKQTSTNDGRQHHRLA